LSFAADAGDQIVAEFALLDPALLDGEVAVKRVADAHDDDALELRSDAIRVHGEAATERCVDPRNCNVPGIVYCAERPKQRHLRIRIDVM
jgi:hypothetical protein